MHGRALIRVTKSLSDGAGFDERRGLDMEVNLFEGFYNVVFRPGDDPTAIGVDSGLGWWCKDVGARL